MSSPALFSESCVRFPPPLSESALDVIELGGRGSSGLPRFLCAGRGRRRTGSSDQKRHGGRDVCDTKRRCVRGWLLPENCWECLLDEHEPHVEHRYRDADMGLCRPR
jgi:hypothetical protein